VVVALYLLKMRRRDVRVPATFLWPEQTEEIRANALFQRLRFSWLLVLQLLALTLIVFCLARPQSSQRGLTGEVTVLVLDSSASMGATDVKPSRFAEAKRLAREAIQSAKPGDRISLIEAGPTPRVVFPLGNDPARQLDALDGVQGTDAEGDVGEALRLASSLVGTLDGARIVLLSDGAFDRVANFSRGKAAVVYRSVGEFDDNLAITALGTAETPKGRQLYCGVRNTCSKPFHGSLTLLADGKAIDSIKFDVAPNGQYGRTIAAPIGAKVFEAKLDAPDALKSDNYAVSLAQAGASLRVLLVSPGDMFLERALALDPRVTLDRASSLPADGGARYDIVVFDGVEESPTKSAGVLTLGAAGPTSPVTVSGTIKAPEFLDAEPSKLMEGVDLRGVYIEKAEAAKPKPEGKVYAESRKGPLLVGSDLRGQRRLYLAFSPLESDFPLQVSFPIFVANALDYLAQSGTGDTLAVRPGAPFTLASKEKATLTDPKGGRHSIQPAANALIVRDVRTVGRHTLKTADRQLSVYASLRSDRESDIAPVKNISLGGGEVKANPSPTRFADFWRPLALLALFVLAFEWWFFARRS
jgi:hypothetical protein